MTHFKKIRGKGVGDGPNDFTEINFEVVDDTCTSGNGLPITKELFKQIVNDYFLLQRDTYAALENLQTAPESNLRRLKDGVDPKAEIISGIYGRDTLMHILEQPGCEGIRYISCLYEGKKSIVLLGVNIEGLPVTPIEKLLDENDPTNPVIYEVKGNSKTMDEILIMMAGKNKLAGQDDLLFKSLLTI